MVRLEVTDQASGLRATSNPIRIGAELPAERRWWGDLHGQSGETVGTNPSADYFHYARYTACADFTCHQGNDFQITDAFWARLRREVDEIHQDGEFVCFHGYEWSGNTEVGGDRNVIFRGIPDADDIWRSGRWLIEDRRPLDPARDALTLDALYARLRGRDDVMLLPHVGGRRAELRWIEPELEPVVEVHSAHGTSEWFLQQALATGVRVGFVAGSDDHMGTPGRHAGQCERNAGHRRPRVYTCGRTYARRHLARSALAPLSWNVRRADPGGDRDRGRAHGCRSRRER